MEATTILTARTYPNVSNCSAAIPRKKKPKVDGRSKASSLSILDTQAIPRKKTLSPATKITPTAPRILDDSTHVPRKMVPKVAVAGGYSPLVQLDTTPIPRKKATKTKGMTSEEEISCENSLSRPQQLAEYEIVFKAGAPLGFYCVTTKKQCRIASVCPTGQNSQDLRLQVGTTVVSVQLLGNAPHPIQDHQDLKQHFEQATSGTVTITFFNAYDVKGDARHSKGDWTSDGKWRGKVHWGWDGCPHCPLPSVELNKASLSVSSNYNVSNTTGDEGDEDDNNFQSAVLARKVKHVDGRALGYQQSRGRCQGLAFPSQEIFRLTGRRKRIRFAPFHYREFDSDSQPTQFLGPEKVLPHSYPINWSHACPRFCYEPRGGTVIIFKPWFLHGSKHPKPEKPLVETQNTRWQIRLPSTLAP